MRFTLGPQDRITIRGCHYRLFHSDGLRHQLTLMPASGQSDNGALPTLFHIGRWHSGSTQSKPPPST
jgi:hypothetical protein